MSFLKKFVPKAPKFYNLFIEVAENGLKATEILNEMLCKWENHADYSSQIHLLEHKCDEITHKVSNELNETFITPIDREDIHELINSLDNVIDEIDVVASRIHLYKVKKPFEFAPQFCEILHMQMKLILEALKNFEEPDKVYEKLISIRNYETQGDKVFREAISNLFENETDIKELIKIKEILELMETAIDYCQTVTIVMEGILIKNA
jgi:predicted phosphate transport protein (TIGR00153 family)